MQQRPSIQERARPHRPALREPHAWTRGSSSGRREVDQVEWDGAFARVRRDRAGGLACTAEMAVNTNELDVPEASAGRITQFESTYEDWDAVGRLTGE